jgi:hypothetical protein
MSKFQRLLKIIFRYFPKSIRNAHYRRVVKKWDRNGRHVPAPHIVKELVIEEYRKRHNCRILVETGTYRGDMIYAEKDSFDKLYSIELDETLFKKAAQKFGKYPHITILHGDSGKVLKNTVPDLDEPVLFWLDGHYSGGITAKGDRECPIFEELETIFTSKHHHVILIDDARCFDGTHDYPTITELTEFVAKNKPGYTVEVKDDFIRLVYASESAT